MLQTTAVSSYLVVDVVPADEDEAVEGGEGEREEGAEAGGETHGGHRLAQPPLVVEPVLPPHHRYTQVKPSIQQQ